MPQAAVLRPGRTASRLRALLAWALPALVFAAALAAFGIRYDTNDDAIIADIAAGAYGPDRVHLVYVNLLFGCLLRPLYALAAGVNWYVAVQLMLLLAAAAALCGLAMRHFGTAGGACVFLAVAVPFAVETVYRFQYSKISAVCTAAGLLFTAAHMEDGPRRGWPGLLLALAGCLLRWDMALAVAALCLPLLAARVWALRGAARRRALTLLALLAALALAAKGIETLAYRLDDGWRAYTEYNAARTAFSDYKAQLLPTEENALADMGVTDTEYALLLGWDFYDGTVFPAARVAALADAVPGRSLPAALRALLRTARELLYGTPCHLAFALTLLAGAAYSLRRRSWVFWAVLAVFGAELFYLIWRDRLPHYIEAPLLLAAVVTLIAALPAPERGSPAVPALLLTAALLFSAPTLAATVPESRVYHDRAGQEQAYFEAMAADREHLYLLSCEAVNVAAGLDVWHPRPAGFYRNILAYGGWLSHAPHREQVLTDWGLAAPLTGAVDNEDVFLDYHNIERAAAYAAERLGRPVQAVADGPNAFAPYRLVTVP